MDHADLSTKYEEEYLSTFLLWKERTNQSEKVNSLPPYTVNPPRALWTTNLNDLFIYCGFYIFLTGNVNINSIAI